MSDLAEPTLLAALAALGLEPRAWHELSRFGRPPRRRGAYRVELRDGRTVKGRVCLTEADGARVAALQDRLRDLPLPRRLARHGRVLVEAWVDGTPVAPDAHDPGLLDDAARLLAAIHRATLEGPPRGGDVGDDPTAALRTTACARLEELRATAVLDDAQAHTLARALAAPPRAAEGTSVVHGDFCAANLVRAHDGRLVVVDNELLDTGPPDYDLGMTWYRWPLDDADAGRFERAYATHAGRAPVGATFFRAVAVTKGLWVRARLDPATLPVALRRLGDLRGS